MACGIVERDVTVDLKGALNVVKTVHYAAITEPRGVWLLFRTIYG